MGRATTSDAELVEASRRGERAAFGELVERYQRVVCAVGYSGTRDHALGEDVAQDTFVAAFHQLDQLRDVSRVREWLCGIARNLARKARRVRQREAPIDEVADVAISSPFDHASEQERDAVVAAALARVPETYREALVLYYCEHRSVPAVASAIGISADAVHQRLSRGRQLVAAEVAELVEHTLERRRTRRNLAVAVLAALPLVVAPTHANASTGGTKMLKLGIATAVVALAGTGYAVHRSHAEAAAQPADQGTVTALETATVARDLGHRHILAGRSFARAATSVSPPPALPAASAAHRGPYDCAAAAHRLAELEVATSTTIESASVSLTRDQIDQLRARLGSGAIVIESAGSATTTPTTAGSTSERITRMGDWHAHECQADHWPQSLIDCFATADDYWNMQCGLPPATEGPPPAAIAAVMDASCSAVGVHVGSLAVRPTFPTYGLTDVPSIAMAALNAQLAPVTSEQSAQIEAACVSGDWSEAHRRCAAAATSMFEFSACR